MTTKITEFLAKQAEAEAGVTPGPWTTFGPDDISRWVIYDSEWAVASAAAYSHDEPLSNKPGARGPGYIDSDANAAFIAHTRTSAPTMRRALEAVLAVHYPSDSKLNLSENELATGARWCSGCNNRVWPCATVRAIESALTGEE